MDRHTKLIAFNNLLNQCITFLIKTFDDDKIKGYELKINMVMKVNPIYVYNCFQKYVLPYKKHIEECNEDFFLKELNNLSTENGTEILDFHSIWFKKENTIEVKSKIFLYFKKFIRLLE